jgi:hypothetical protein
MWHPAFQQLADDRHWRVETLTKAGCRPKRSTAVNESGIAAEAAAVKAGGAQYADITDLFCTADRCPVIVGNTLVYSDWSHITVEVHEGVRPGYRSPR